MVSADGRIAAVLDWEICTLGDPLADLGLLMVYWTGPDDWEGGLATSATAVEGFPNRAELLERYTKTSGRDAGDIDFYTAFAFWKLACIVEGVYARYLGGAMGSGARGLRDVQGAGRAQRRERRGDRAAGVVSDGAAAPLYELHSRPTLDSPALVVALEGWIDAGLGAAAAAQALVADLHPTAIATFDADRLLDYRARRPVMHLRDGVNTSLTWPGIELYAAKDHAGPRRADAPRARARLALEAVHRAGGRARA